MAVETNSTADEPGQAQTQAQRRRARRDQPENAQAREQVPIQNANADHDHHEAGIARRAAQRQAEREQQDVAQQQQQEQLIRAQEDKVRPIRRALLAIERDLDAFDFHPEVNENNLKLFVTKGPRYASVTVINGSDAFALVLILAIGFVIDFFTPIKGFLFLLLAASVIILVTLVDSCRRIREADFVVGAVISLCELVVVGFYCYNGASTLVMPEWLKILVCVLPPFVLGLGRSPGTGIVYIVFSFMTLFIWNGHLHILVLVCILAVLRSNVAVQYIQSKVNQEWKDKLYWTVIGFLCLLVMTATVLQLAQPLKK
jgi:hypothetical protein